MGVRAVRMGADKEVLPYSYKIEGVNKIKGPEEEELVVDWRRRVGTLGVEEEGGWLPI